MFAFFGLGMGEFIVLGVIGSGLVAVVVLVLVLAIAKGIAGAKQTADEGRNLRVEMDRLREENQQLREEIKRLREQVGPSADTGVKQG